MGSDFQKALRMIDEAHSLDPNSSATTPPVPYELHYAQKMTTYLFQHTSEPSIPLQLACRAQHFRRWEVPRSSYPEGKAGYFAWRTFLKKRQGAQVKRILIGDCGYDEDTASRVESLIGKEDLKRGEGKGDAEAQVLEDVACLVFLDDQFDEFEEKHDEEKIIKIVQKTWTKMGKRGQDLALEMHMSERAKELVGKALR